MTDYTRISYELDGRMHTFWAESDTVRNPKRGGITAENIETGNMKWVSESTPTVVTHGVTLPASVAENAGIAHSERVKA